jgi:EamA domain-containing membrane protein RarD
VAVFTIEGWLRPGYNWLSTFISELSIGPRGRVKIINFIILGTLFLVFTWGVAAEFREGKASKWGPILLAIIGFGFLVSGPLVTDVAGTPRDQMSLHGIFHGIFGALVFSLSPVSVFIFWRRFREDPNWQQLQAWSLTAGIITTVALIIFTASAKQPVQPNVFTPWNGLIQRMVIVPYLIWIFTFAFHLRHTSNKP